GGTLAGEVAGVAALGHPANFRGPQKMRIHDTLPYMTFAPVRDGDFTLEPATPYVTRFRYVTTDGPPDAALFDRLWNDYATPPTVAVTPRQAGLTHSPLLGRRSVGQAPRKTFASPSGEGARFRAPGARLL